MQHEMQHAAVRLFVNSDVFTVPLPAFDNTILTRRNTCANENVTYQHVFASNDSGTSKPSPIRGWL